MATQLPVYRMSPDQAFPEVLGLRENCKAQSTMDSERKLAGIVLSICMLIKTGKPPLDLTIEQFHKELLMAAEILDVPLDRMISWAESVCLEPDVTLTKSEMSAIPTRNIAKGFDLHQYQIETAAWAARRLGSVLALGCGTGKAQPEDEPVLTPSGWRMIGDIRAGDYVIGSNGTATEVLAVFKQGQRSICRVTFSDGSTTRCDWDHLWSVEDNHGRHATLTTRELKDRGLTYGVDRTSKRWRVPLVAPVEFDHRGALPVDPYLLGVLLGDGTLNTGKSRGTAMRYSKTDPSVAEVLRQRGIIAIPNTAKDTWAIQDRGLRDVLRSLGLLGHTAETKFIPPEYLTARPSDRLALLRGLMDTDGTCSDGHHWEFSTASSRLADGVVELVQSLGAVATRGLRKEPKYWYKGRHRTGLPSHRISISATFNPFAGRKAAQVTPRTKYLPSRRIADISPAGEANCVCIQVAAADHLYVTSNYVVTHNTATSIAAAIGAKRLGTLKGDRAYVICPLNAMQTWRRASVDLQQEFKDVQLVSIDSLHHYKGLTVAEGGALILDECHRAKHEETGRTKEAYQLRRCFEWCTSLTGSLLHTGPEGIMTILDLSCPGLSRFLDKWAFGEAFACIAGKKVQIRGVRRIKHSLVIPGEESRPPLAKYLERAVRSLSTTSPEVSSVLKLPGQTATTVDSWDKPEWVEQLIAECRTTVETAAKAPAGAVIPGIQEVVWAPTAPWQDLMGALAVCIMEETREEILEVASELNSTAVSNIDDAVRSIRDKLNDPMFRANDQEWLGRRKPLEALIKNPGLPTFSKVLHAACRLGRYDHVIVKHTELVKGLKNTTWRFKYGPGRSRKNPGIGPKCQFVLDWLRDNPGEPLVAGAAGKGAINVLSAAMAELGVTHRIIRGGVSSKHREQFVDEFNRGEAQVMLVQQVAGSESIDLIRASTSLLVDHDWSASTYEQYLARTNRQGQKRECFHFDLAFNGVQIESIGRLIRGRDFDAQTRALLEQECNNRERTTCMS